VLWYKTLSRSTSAVEHVHVIRHVKKKYYRHVIPILAAVIMKVATP
jgi:hypothetical protein